MDSTENQEPRLVQTPTRWLALSQPEVCPRIGVFGPTEEEASKRFRDRLKTWKAWADQHKADRDRPKAERDNYKQKTEALIKSHHELNRMIDKLWAEVQGLQEMFRKIQETLNPQEVDDG